ncbi:hypothetical protein J4573_31800 [Actinomadura barringtoniae]|uniref:Uncharacterized protein n=1 Tax=Actinomadura barringtoniae TaxID=1427535 RepID=A0A939PKE8_9ACTN|nr:hypothetical protein [Actinomadura barringtoniae]MBO2451713.1 hypothetical protein [Actinomadura barringtoniae]
MDQTNTLGARWSGLRVLAGYGAALCMGLYLLVKVIWVVAALFGHAPDDFGSTDWIALNATTVVMSGTGVALGLAMAQRWGFRLPAAPVLFFSWVGAGFLVPLIPFMLLRTVIGDGGNSDDGGSSTPSWETLFITIGFAGMAIGLAIALPIYLRQRWPQAFVGKVGDLTRTRATLPALGAGLLGITQLYWAFGGTLGINPAHRADLDTNGRMLCASWGIWALIGLASLYPLTTRRPTRLSLWIPTSLAFGASGSMFAWSAWKLPMTLLHPGGFTAVEYLPVAIAEHLLAMAVGLTTMNAVIRVTRQADPG